MTVLTRLLTPGRMAALILALLFCVTIPYPASAGLLVDRVLEKQPVTDGLEMEKHLITTTGGDSRVYVLKADLTNPYLKINTLVGADGSLEKNARVADMAAGAGSVAAVNADFFQMSESGRPIGMTYRDGEMITSPPLRDDMFGWSLSREGEPYIGIFSFSGKVTAANGTTFPLAGVNKPSYFQAGGVDSHQDTLLMYDRSWGAVSRGKTGSNDDVTEVFVSNGIVTGINLNQPGRAIPVDGYVLAGRGAAAEYIESNIRVGDRLTVDYTVAPDGENIWAGTGGWQLLVDNGRVMSSFPGDTNGPAARTAIGYTPGGESLVLVVVEKSTGSRGVTLEELAEYMSRLGVARALNLDGGGSTTLAARPLGDEKAVLVNRPQNNVQRLVPTALGFFSTAPRGNLAGLVLKGPDQVFPGESITYTARGYDNHYNPYAVIQEGVKFSTASGKGSFDGNVFTASDVGVTVIEAETGGVRGIKEVRVLGPADFSRMWAEPSALDVSPGGVSELKVIVAGNDGMDYLLPLSNYSVSVDPSLGRFEEGSFKAADGPAAGQINIAYGYHSAVIPVKVKQEGQDVVQCGPGQAGSLTLGDFSARFTGGAFDVPVTVLATRGGEAAGPVPQQYHTIDTVTLEALGEGAVSPAEPVEVTWKYKTGGGDRVAVLQFADDKWREIPFSVSEGEDKVVCSTSRLGPLALVSVPQSPAVSYKDMNGHWAAAAVGRLSAAGIISGYPDNTFMPDKQVTRAEFVVMLSKAMKWQPEQGELKFRDRAVIYPWAAGYVLTASRKGVISGYGDGTFRPANAITRAEMSAMTVKALSLPPAGNIQLDKMFSDASSIDKWAVDPVSRAVAAGIMSGDNEKRFRAKDRATRAESAVIMDNVLKYLGSKQ